jgi:hypothetical protein
VGLGAGLGGWPGRGAGVDLIAGIGRGLLGRGIEKADWLVTSTPRVNIVNNIILLVFIFLNAQAPGEILCRRATELSPPGPWALDCLKGHALRASPSLSCHLLIRKRQTRVRKNVKFSDSRRFWQMGSARTAWDSGSNRDSQRFIATAGRDHRSKPQVRARSSTTNKSDSIAGMFMPIFKGELGDPRFVNLA